MNEKKIDKTIAVMLNKCLCDYKCIFCSRGSSCYQRKLKNCLRGYDYRSGFLSIQQIIAHHYEKNRYMRIKLGGNEPLTHPLIIKIVHFAHRVGYQDIIIQTTGQRLANAGFARELAAAGMTSIDVPFYGAAAATHDRIARKKGGYLAARRAVYNLCRLGINVGMHTLILRQNFKEIPRMLKMFNRIKVEYPRPILGDFLNYKKICVKYSDIPKEANIFDFGIPCINKTTRRVPLVGDRQYSKRMANNKSGREIKFNEDDPWRELSKSPSVENNEKTKLPKCMHCLARNFCNGIHPAYLHLFGEAEFQPISSRDAFE